MGQSWREMHITGGHEGARLRATEGGNQEDGLRGRQGGDRTALIRRIPQPNGFQGTN